LFETFIVVVVVLQLAGCNGDAPAANTGATSSVLRGPEVLEIEGDANGLWWNDEEQALYIADDNGNRILKWTDEDGASLVANLPSATPEGAGLGQLVLTENGDVVVTRFGFGTTGDVATISAEGDVEIVPDLDVERRRIGLTVTEDGILFDSWFVRLATGDRVGAIGELSLSGTETEVITGLQKPVGVLAMGDELFVSDQDLGQLLKAPLSEPSDYVVLATVESPDLLAAGPNGTLFTGSAGGSLYQISAEGEASVFESGFRQVRGIAYDPTNERVFIADHDPDETDGISHVLHVFPVD
jgi:hypothetical protein